MFSLSACATATHHSQNTHKIRDTWFGEDKLYHFLTASVIGAAATKVAVNNQAAPCDAMFIGISATLVIGTGKEWYDMRVKKTLFSWKDMAWNLAGSSVGSFAVSDCR
jgi:putative lipoprotein